MAPDKSLGRAITDESRSVLDEYVREGTLGRTTLSIKQPLFCKCLYELAGHLAFMFR